MLRIHFNRESDTPKETYLEAIASKVWGCGSNSGRQLGLGNVARVDVPTLIPDLNNIIAISTGLFHSMFLDRNVKFGDVDRIVMVN